MATTAIPMQLPVASTPYQVMDARPGYSQRYNSQGGIVTGIIQLVCGFMALVLGIAAFALELTYYFVATGLWAGMAFFAITGVLGIISAKRQTGVIVGYMVMSILSAIVAFFACWCYLGVVVTSVTYCRDLFHGSDYNVRINCDARNADVAINSILTIVFFVEFVVSIVGSGFTCGGVCCGSSASVTTTHMSVTNQAVTTEQGGWSIHQGYANAPPQYQVKDMAPGKI